MSDTPNYHETEIEMKAKPGLPMLFLCFFLLFLATAAVVAGAILLENGRDLPGGVLLSIGVIYLCFSWIPFLGLKIIKPNEALVFTLFGNYVGTLKKAGYYYVNPFVSAVNPAATTILPSADDASSKPAASQNPPAFDKRISLKVMTLSNNKQKINDLLGNPIEIGIVVIWRIVNTVKAVFNVNNYKEYLSIQCDSALRNIVRRYPYDVSADEDEKSLRGSSQEVAERLKAEIQAKVEVAGIEILEARITHLAYAPEIAAAMLQRQQAAAIVDARKLIVEGAVGMVEMALDKLSEGNVVELDDERKAAMVSNLLVVLCGNRDAQPVVNSGSLY